MTSRLTAEGSTTELLKNFKLNFFLFLQKLYFSLIKIFSNIAKFCKKITTLFFFNLVKYIYMKVRKKS